MNFGVEGPFELARYESKRMITKQSLRDLELKLDTDEPGLAEACGCYVFAMHAGKGYTPWYVGQACKSSISQEALNSTNREKYTTVLQHRSGTPVIFLIPLLTPSGRFRKRPENKVRLAALNFLERWLIWVAIQKNPDLINTRETKFLREIHVTGIFNAGQGEWSGPSAELRRTLWKPRKAA